MKLQDYFGRIYGARTRRTEPMTKLIAEFKEAAALDPTLTRDANTWLASIDNDVCDRDVISRHVRDFLKQAMA